MPDVKILVVYDSKTGHTKAMAEAVGDGAKGVKGINVALQDVKETTIEHLESACAIIAGSPTYYGLMSSNLKRLFDDSAKVHGKLAGKVGAAFTSCGGTHTGGESTLLSIVQAMLVHGMIVQGRADDMHYGMVCVGKPKEDDLKKCTELGRRTAELAIKIFG